VINAGTDLGARRLVWNEELTTTMEGLDNMQVNVVV
jgi:hypothetical protein